MVDIQRPPVNEGAGSERAFSSGTSPPARPPEPPVRLYPSSIDACEETADGSRGDSRELGTMAKPSCHGFRGKVIHEHPLHEVPQGRVVHDAHPLIFCIFPPDVCLVVGGAGDIAPPHRVAHQFTRNRVGASPDERRDSPAAVSLRTVPRNFFPIRPLQLPPCAALFLS